MKTFAVGFPEVDTDAAKPGPVQSRPPEKQVLEYTRSKANSGSPLINGDAPALPHSINAKPEVSI